MPRLGSRDSSCVAVLEGFSGSIPGAAARIITLEDYCSVQSKAAAVIGEWNHDIADHIREMEQKVDGLELIRFSEMRDERNDRVTALEDTTAVFEDWRPWVEASLYDVFLEIRRLSKPAPPTATELVTHYLGTIRFNELASVCPAGA